MSKGMNRRDFLKSSFAGMGAMVFLPAESKGWKERLMKGRAEGRTFVYRTLGRTGVKIPVISMGVMNTDNPNLVRAAMDAGYFHFDTAQTYQRGTNEAMIGEILRGRPRDSFFIATKARLPNDSKTGLYTQEATEEAFAQKIDKSLKSLGLDTIDIYYHHNVWAKESVTYEPILNALAKAKKAGKIRFTGITTHRNEPEVIRAAVESNFYDVIETAYNYRQKHASEMKQAIAQAAGAGIGIVAMKTIGGNVRGSYAAQAIDPSLAIKWALEDSNVHTVIAGCTTFEQMETDLAIMKDLSIPNEDREKLRRAGLDSPLYCQGCGKCLGQCLQGLPIPDLMRAYMYAYGYRNWAAAQDVLDALDLPAALCVGCGACPIQCSNRWKVSARIRDIGRLGEIPAEFRS
jgi:predicted aldo/keto reductase-like oxidoreductase